MHLVVCTFGGRHGYEKGTPVGIPSSFYLFEASYCSIVLVTMVQVVSPRWKYSDCVVIVRVTLQLETSTPVKMMVIIFLIMVLFH